MYLQTYSKQYFRLIVTMPKCGARLGPLFASRLPLAAFRRSSAVPYIRAFVSACVPVECSLPLLPATCGCISLLASRATNVIADVKDADGRDLLCELRCIAR